MPVAEFRATTMLVWKRLFEKWIGTSNERVVEATIGVPTSVLMHVWNRCSDRIVRNALHAYILDITELSQQKRIHLLWALHFLKRYEVIDVAHTRWGCSEKTYRTTVWEVLFELHDVLNEVILFPLPISLFTTPI